MLNCKRCNEHQATICSHCAGEYGELQTKNEIALWLDEEALEALESYQAQVNKVTGVRKHLMPHPIHLIPKRLHY